MMMINILWYKQGNDLIYYDDMYGKKYDDHCKSYGDNYGKTFMAKNMMNMAVAYRSKTR